MLYLVSPGFQCGTRAVGKRFLSNDLSKAFASVEQPKIDRTPLKIGKERYNLIKELVFKQSQYHE